MDICPDCEQWSVVPFYQLLAKTGGNTEKGSCPTIRITIREGTKQRPSYDTPPKDCHRIDGSCVAR